jgi:ketosteroid isomerase-like protein
MTDQLRALFEKYSEAYDRCDPDGAAAFITCPLVTVRAGEVTVYDSPDKIRAFLAKLLEWFTGIRHGKTSISKLEVRPLGESSAFVNVVWRSIRDDGVMYTEWPTAYHLVKTGNAWKILVIVLRYETPREGSCS